MTVNCAVDTRSTAEVLKRLVGAVGGVVAVKDSISWRLDDRGATAPDAWVGGAPPKG